MIKYENKTYLTTNETAKYLGKNSTSFRQFIQRTTFPRRKLGGRLYFELSVLDGYFARKAGDQYKHFESSGLSYEEVLTFDQLQEILMTTKQNLYYFTLRHEIQRYKDNANRTLLDKVKIMKILSQLKTTVADL